MNARIQVGIRLRPFLENEIQKGYNNSKIRVDKSSGKISIQSAHGQQSQSTRIFEFDHIFEQSTNQEDIYAETQVSSMITRVLDGFHSTIFAYGQTGSGKTFTMEGKHDNGIYTSETTKGIVARSLDDLFSQISRLKASNSKSYNVTCSFLQIYNEKIYDLLSQQPSAISAASASTQQPYTNPPGLKLRWNAREQFQVENLFVFDVKNPKEAQSYFLAGVRNRITASHKLNMTSSRSHTIFTITVHTYTAEGAHETSSKLQLVDLAGSERIAQTGTEGKLAKESIDINKSLFTLRQVITALSEINQQSNGNSYNNTTDLESTSKLQHIPYRDSKLTSLLKQSIGGNCYCLMIACVVPNDSFVDENVSTLHYATRATYIKNQPVKNEDPNKQILSEVINENSSLRSELDKANKHISFLTASLQKSEATCFSLKQQLANASHMNQAAQPHGNQTIQDDQPQQYTKQQSQQQSQSIDDKQFRRSMNRPPAFNDEVDPSSTATAFVQAHHMETVRQSQGVNSHHVKAYAALKSTTNKQQSLNQTIDDSEHYSSPTNPMMATTATVIKGPIIQAGEQENFNERLIESISLVRQLLESNKDLRYQTDQTKLRMRQLEQELSDLTSENQKLLENHYDVQYQPPQASIKQKRRQTIDQNEGEQNDEAFNAPPSSDQLNSKRMTINNNGPIEFKNSSRNDLIQEIIELRNAKKALESKMKNSNNDFDRTLPKLNGTGQQSQQQQQQQYSLPHNNMKNTPMNNTNSTINSAISTGRSNYVFYSASKQPRGNSQQPSATHRQNLTASEDQFIGQQSSLNDVLMYSTKNQQLGGVSASTDYSNRSFTDIQNAYQNRQPAAVSAGGMDSFPTNFGRYTLYQSNFHSQQQQQQQQQLSKLQSPSQQIQIQSDSQRTPFSSQRISETKRHQPNTTHSGYSSQDEEPLGIQNVNMNDISVNSVKRPHVGMPPYRSNSLNKQKTTAFNPQNEVISLTLQQELQGHSDNVFHRQRSDNEKIKSFQRQFIKPNQ